MPPSPGLPNRRDGYVTKLHCFSSFWYTENTAAENRRVESADGSIAADTFASPTFDNQVIFFVISLVHFFLFNFLTHKN